MKIRSRKQALKRFLFSLSLFTIVIFGLLKLVDKAKVKKLRVIQTNGTSLFLENLFGTEDDIEIDNSIFFLDTTRMKNPHKQRELTLRQICSIESAAMSNPHMRIFVIIVSPFVITKAIKFTPQMNAILNYPNVYLKAMHLVQYTIDSPLENFIANGSIFKSRFIRAHTADALRLLLLWKFGGTYLDTDMIVRKNLSSVSNFICREHGFLNQAIININIKGKRGRNFAEMFMQDMIENFDGNEWSTNGPFMLQRVLSKLCKTSDVNEMHNCNGFHVLEDSLCYPVKGTKWELLFDEKIGNEIVELTKNSLVVHFWNKLSHMQKLKCESNAAYTQLARKFCPKTMSYCEDFFWGWK
ncbi:hypothetical protein PVAND_004214 [Polypedilum vanderplanki]|uniref:Alpha 1,4-glycosyltransferase domain-containing protein n=1 Tax=Polypedilum vanderplanki TaxID=319348 RepID=A0A9J6BWW3_POLVA|nr:hypothetical protein PVAND_004214 [Polypedilum vanderplanki]